MPGVEVRPEPLDSPVARRLIAELNAELSLDYPPAQRFHSLDAEEVAEGAGAFLVLWLDGGAARRRAGARNPADAIPPGTDAIRGRSRPKRWPSSSACTWSRRPGGAACRARS